MKITKAELLKETQRLKRKLSNMKATLRTFEEIESDNALNARKWAERYAKLEESSRQSEKRIIQVQNDRQSQSDKFRDLQRRHDLCMKILSALVLRSGGVVAIRKPLACENTPILEVKDDDVIKAYILTV